MRDTCPKEERMLITPGISELASEVLTSEEIEKVETLTRMLVLGAKSKRKEAIGQIQLLLLPPPKRPLYYLHYSLRDLPHNTRHVILDLCPYIELLVKAFLYDMGEKKNATKNAPRKCNTKNKK